jgi:hypothetical protein
MPDISTILILTKPNAFSLQGYFVAILAQEWETQGIRVVVHNDLDSSVPADVCLVHVDLSVVPSRYIEFAQRYPNTSICTSPISARGVTVAIGSCTEMALTGQ